MNEINFLPPSYRNRGRRRRRWVRQVVLLLLVAGGVAYWRFRGPTSLSGQEEYLRSLESQAAAQQTQEEELARLDQRQMALAQQVRLQRDACPAVSTTALMGALAQLMPPSLGLTSLSLEGKRPTPTLPGKSGPDSGETAKASPPEAIRVDMIGLAPEDVEVAEFVGRLTASPIYSNVKMLYSKPTQAGDLIGRQFRIELEVRLDREYRPTTAPPVAGGLSPIVKPTGLAAVSESTGAIAHAD